jgi:crotonobetaine/carnitine-CoA ligase
MNVARFVHEQAERYAERTLAVLEDGTLSYAQLSAGAGAVTAGLLELGVQRGDRVALMMASRREFLLSWFGVLGAGAIEVPIHDAARGSGITYILETTGARFLIVDDENLAHVSEQIGGLEALELMIVVGDGPLPVLPRPVRRFADVFDREPESPVAVDPGEPASILFTGGTTGPPKGVVVSHAHNLNMARSYVELVGYTEEDVLYSVFPLFHANAKYMSVLIAIAAGARVVVHRRFSASRFWEICRTEGVTAFNGLGEMLRILLKQPQRDDDAVNPVRMVIGSAAPTEVVQEFERRYDLAVLDVYGLSETGPITAVTWDQRRPGSCGRPVPWYELRIVDDCDVEVPRGQTGQIVVRPNRPHVMMERYWGNDAATLALLRNLWFHTGDYARQDEDGFVWFLERVTDSIRRRGENVSAWEVERVLADHPDLLEVAVYGVPSDVGGEEIAAAVVLRSGADLTAAALLDFCGGKLPHFAVPRYVRIMDGLPRNHAQRVLKKELKADGVDAPGVWDRESAGYVVQR